MLDGPDLGWPEDDAVSQIDFENLSREERMGVFRFLASLEQAGYAEIRLLPGRQFWGAVIREGFMWAVKAGRLDPAGLGLVDVWCYPTRDAAAAALAAWSAGDEPPGWHWHPASARRRPGGRR